MNKDSKKLTISQVLNGVRIRVNGKQEFAEIVYHDYTDHPEKGNRQDTRYKLN